MLFYFIFSIDFSYVLTILIKLCTNEKLKLSKTIHNNLKRFYKLKSVK